MAPPLHTATTPFWPRHCPEFVQLRRAVRQLMRDAANDHGGVVIGLSGGADSLALVAACAAEATNTHAHVHAAIVDHNLQQGSAEIATRAAATVRPWGVHTHIISVTIATTGAGPEADARTARHAALHEIATRHNWPLLLAHTADDQAETMLLRLARGGGPTALSGIAPTMTWPDGVVVHRPLLALRRHHTRATCHELGLQPWDDPHNDDDTYTRVRVRHQLIPAYEKLLGPGIVENLAHTAAVLREDHEALEAIARRALAESAVGEELVIDSVTKQPKAVRIRMYQQWARQVAGVAQLGRTQLSDIERLVTDYHGQGPVAVPKKTRCNESEGMPGEHGRLVIGRKGGNLAVSWNFCSVGKDDPNA